MDKYSADKEFMTNLKAEKDAMDKEFEDEELKQVKVPAHLTKELSENLLKQKENAVNKVVQEFQQQARAQGGYAYAHDLETKVIRAKAHFDDMMYLQQGITGKELLKAVMENGVYDERMKEAKKLEEAELKRRESVRKMFEEYRQDIIKRQQSKLGP